VASVSLRALCEDSQYDAAAAGGLCDLQLKAAEVRSELRYDKSVD